MARTILIVNDNAAERMILQEYLGDKYTVIEVDGGAEMISVLRKRGQKLSAILLNLVMPGMDGFQALCEIRDNSDYCQIPVIVASVQSDDATQAKALSLGATGFVTKPYNKDILLPLLENTISLREKSARANSFSLSTLLGQEPSEAEVTAARFRTLFEDINGGISVVIYEDDGKVRLAYANARYYNLFGYTKEQFTEELKTPHDTTHPDDRDSVAKRFAEAKATKQTATFRYRVIKRDKSIAYIRCNLSFTTIEGVSGYILISILTDITESVRLEQQTIVYGQRLDAIMKNMNSAVTASLVKNDGTVEFLFANDLYHEIFGYTKEQFQTEVRDPCQLIYPDDLDDVHSAVFSLHGIGDTKELLYRAITRDGKIKWLRAHITMMTFPDACGPVQLAVYADVTDIVEAREKISAQRDQIAELLNDTPSGIAIIEVDPKDIASTKRTIFYNDRFISFFGCDRDEYDALLKNNEMAFVFTEDIPILMNDIKKLCAEEIGVSADSVVRCHTKYGGFRWLLFTGQLTKRRGDICVINVAIMDVTERKEAIDRQRISEEMLRIAAETDQRSIIVYDVKKNTCRAESRTLFSARYGDVFENIPQSLIDMGLTAPDSEDELCSLFARIREGEKRICVSLQMYRGPDKYEWFECNASTVFDNAGLPDHAILVFHNVTEQRVKEAVFRKWQQSIAARPAKSYTLFRCNLTKDASLDQQDGELLKISFPADTLSFNSRTKLYVEEFVYPDDREAYTKLLDSDTLLAMFYRGEHFVSLDYRESASNREVNWHRVTIEMVEYPNSTDVQAFLMYEDIDAKKKAEIAAIELAKLDTLTGALNRDAFADAVDEMIRENHNSPCALIMLDLDGFKQLNDSFGHAAGDQALQEVVAVLRSYSRKDDLVCRLGGDEFLVWLRDVPYDAVIVKAAQQMCEHIRKAYSQEVLLSASAGIAIYPRDGQSFDDLYPNADKALYKVKQAGKGSCAFFSTIKEEQTTKVTEALSEIKPSLQSPRGTKRRMLIVDDNELNRLTLKNIFKDEYLIEIAKNGVEAMIRLRHFRDSISVVLLDIMMPGIDGFAVLKKVQNDVDLRTIPIVVVTGDENHETLLKAFDLGAAEYVVKPVDVDIIRMRVKAVISKAENERLRAQNSYLMLQRDEEEKYHTVLESTGTAVVEYDWRNHVFIYDGEISKHIAGNFNNRGLWQIFLSDMVADSNDVKALQDMLIALAGNRERDKDSKLVRLKTPVSVKHWFRVNFYKRADDYGLADKLIITFNDVHDEVLKNDRLLFQATRDELTGLYNRAGFLEKASELINARESGYYVMACIDVEKFQVINDRYGTDKGDKVLKHMAVSIGDFVEHNGGICCRYTADRFAVLYPAKLLGTDELAENHRLVSMPDCIPRTLRLCIGRCMVSETSLPVSAMFDRAAMAGALAKGRYDTYIVDYDESMRDNILKEQQIVGDMVDALQNGEFEPWFQPQYNHATGALIGAEALVRWRKDGKIIPPNDFIPVFEKNGFIYEVDQSIWRQVCAMLRRWLDEGRNPLPISVNISRHDMFQENFIEVITGLVAEYRLPVELLRLEITESAFSADTATITGIAGQLIASGFTVEIDDFGSGYSSLNTLKDVPASILKLDMRFFERSGDAKRGGNIVESIVRMAKWLGMAVIAEGVEDKAQADYLKSIGCFYIQGYYYAKPMPVDEYEKRLDSNSKEAKLSRLKTLQNLDNNDFWDSRSMDTLIFNSYVGAACILELNNGKVEMLRATDHYARMLSGGKLDIKDILAIDWSAHMDNCNTRLFADAVMESLNTKEIVVREIEFRDLPGCPKTVILRSTLRVIATVGERHLIYCLSDNMTAQRAAEHVALNASERINAVMDHCHSGITAVIARPDSTVEPIFVNNRFFEIMGYTREQYVTEVKSPYDRVLPEDHERVINTIINLNKIGSTASLELREMRRDGSIVWLRWDASVVRFANISEPVQLANFLDITEQKENELKQLESARQMDIIMSNINGGVSAIQIFDDATSKFVFNNDKYYDLYGYTREEALAENLDIMTLIHSEDLPVVMEKVRQMKEDHQPCIIDYRITKKDGSHAMLRVNASLMSIPGYGDDVITSVVTDITERKSIEERLDAIVDNINGGISAVYLYKDKPEYVIANEQYYKLLGYTKEEFEAESVNPFDLLHPDDREWVTKKYTEMQKYGERYTMEYRIIRRDGAERNILCNTSVLQLFGIDAPLQLAVSNDITELRETQRQELAVKDRLSTVMNTMSNAITAVAFHDDGMEFLFANNRFYEIYGIRRGDIGADHLTDALSLVIPKYREVVRNALREAVKTMKTTSMDYQIQRPDGALRWIHVTINMTKLAGINAPVQVAVLSDITDEKIANDQIRFLNESASEILAQPDSDKAINNVLQKLLKYFAGERSYVFELNDVARTSDNTYEICAPGITEELQRLQGVPYDMQQTWLDAFRKTGFVAISDVAAIEDSEKAVREILLVQNIRSIIVAPLWRDGKLIGYVGVDNPTIAVDQVSQLIALADYIAVLLTRRDLMRKIEHDSETVQQIMDDTPGGFVRMELFRDKDPAIVNVNDGLCKILGMTRDELIETYGDDPFAALADDDAAVAADEIREAYVSGGQYTSTCKLRRKDGSLFWVMLFGRFVHGENGRLFLNAYFTDITEKLATEENKKTLLDNLPFGAAMYEFDGARLTVIHINRQYWKLVGREPTEYSKTSVTDAIHPEDRAVTIQEIQAAIRQGRGAAVDIRVLNGEGGYSPFHVTASIVPQEDGRYQLFVAYSPISDEAISLQEMLPIALSTMVSSSEDISYVKDKDLRYICVSPSVAKMVGVENPRDLVGKSAEEVFGKESAEKFNYDDRHVIETGETVTRALDRIPAADGSVLLVRTSKYPILNAAGHAIGLYCVSQDITAQKEKESQLELLTNTIPGGLVSYSISKAGVKTLFFNDGFFAYSGYTREEYTAITEKEPLALMFEEDRDKLRAVLRTFAAQRQEGMTGSCDYRCHTKDGQTRYMSLKAVLTQLDDDHYVLNAVQFDMTQHAEIEQRMENLLDNLPFGAAMYEFNGEGLKVLHINQRYQKTLGLAWNKGAFDDYPPIDFIHPDDRSVTLNAIKDAIANNRDASCNIRILYGETEYRSFHIDARIMAQPDGKYIVYAAYTRLSEQELTFEKALPHMFSTVMESSTDLAFAKDVNFRYICCSRTFATLLGLASENEVVGKTDYELFPKEIADMFRRDDSALFDTQKPQIDIQEMIPSPDGTKHYIRTSKHLMRSDTDAVIGIYCIGRDITEVQEAYAQLRLLTDSIPGGIATFRCSSCDIETIYINDGVCELAGLSREEYDAHPVPMLDLIFTEDRPIISEQIELMQSGEKRLNFTVRIHTKDGGYKWINDVATVTDNVGEVYIINAVLTDVTEQQEEKERLRLAEEEYRIATEHSARTICRYNIADMTLKVAHEAAIRLALPSVIQGVPYEQIKNGSVSSDTADNYLAFFERILQGEKVSACVFCKKLNNRWRWLNARSTTIFDLSGKPVSAIISFKDITEEQEKELIFKKWEQSLTERKSGQYTLYRCNLNKDVSYDTKEGSLFGYVVDDMEDKLFNECTMEFCDQYVVEDDRSKYIEFLDSNRLLANYHRGVRSGELIFRARLGEDNTRWIRLTVELLEYPDSTDVEAYLMYEDINDSVLDELNIKRQAETDSLTGLQNRKIFIERVNGLIGQKLEDSCRALFLLDIDYFKHINDTFGHRVGDESIVSMAGVILSVIKNDGVVCRLGGDEFLVFLSDMPSRDSVADKARALCEAAHIIIKDNIQISVSIGVALVTDEGENFDSMYHKADKALYHVKDYGRNNYAFYETDMERDDSEVISDAVGGSLIHLAGGKNTMLVVDDSAINRLVTAGVFKKDFSIIEAENGQVALDYLREHSDDVAIVLLDIMMPVMDGYQLLEVMKTDPVLQEVPVIVISGEDDRKASLRAIQSGASEYIVKPVDTELLRLRVSSALSKSENGRLRKQNNEYAVDSQELHSYRALMDSNATVLIEYNTKTGDFKYAPKTSDYLNGTFDKRPIWQILVEDKIASNADAEVIRKMITESEKPCKATFSLNAPDGTAHPFLMKVILRDVAGNDDVVLITLTDRS